MDQIRTCLKKETNFQDSQTKENHIKECPICAAGTMNFRKGSFGFFYGCSRFPKCKHVVHDLNRCPKCQRGGKCLKSRSSGRFWVCSTWPSCSYTEAPNHILACPDCELAPMVPRKGLFGPFYGCSRYPSCKHIVESLDRCPKCGKGGKRLRRSASAYIWRCSTWPKCCYSENV